MNRTEPAPNATRATTVSGVRLRFAACGAVFFAALVALGTGLTGGVASAGTLAAVLVYLVAMVLCLQALEGYPHRALGLCNVVTLFRLVLVCGLIAVLVTPAAGPWTIFGIAATTLALDGVDGWLARRGGHVSDFGARFDMEVDGVLALVLALLAYAGGHAGGFIVLLGLPIYLFRGAQIMLPWLKGDLPARFSRKLVCVVQIAVLIGVLLPVVGRPLGDLLAGGAALALVWSFAVDIRHLRGARAWAFL